MLARVLIAAFLLLNGMAASPAFAVKALGETSPAGHASHSAAANPGPHSSHAHHSTDSGVPAGGDCCDTVTCDCGCAAPQAATLPISMPRISWRVALPEFIFAVKSFHSNPIAAPFRPPA